MYGCTDGPMYRTYGCTDVRMYGCTDVQMYGCTDVRMYELYGCNGRTEVRKYASANIINYDLINSTVDRLTYRTDVRLYGCTLNITILLD